MMFESKSFVYLACFIVNLLTVCVSIAFGWSSPVIPKLNGSVHPELNPLGRPITILETSWITSLLNIGAACSSLFVGRIGDLIGRKNTLMIFAIPMIIGNVILIFANNVEEIYVARFLMGVSSGAAYCLVPVFSSEISEPANRGLLGVLFYVTFASSLLITFAIGPYVTIQVLSIISVVVCFCFVVILSFVVPDTPYFYVLSNRIDEAEKSLRKYRNAQDVSEEMKEIERTIEQSRIETISIKDIVKDSFSRKAVFICMGLMFFQQFTGNQAMGSYLQTIFQQSGSTISPEISAMVIAFECVVMSIVISCIVEKVGRRKLLILSLAGAAILLFVKGTYFYFKQNNYDMKSFYWLPLCAILLYDISYNIGQGPVAVMMLGEILPPKVKATTSTAVTFVLLFLMSVLTWIYPILQEELTIAGSMWFFCGFTLLGIVFTYFFVPETKDKTLEEIQNQLREKHIAGT